MATVAFMTSQTGVENVELDGPWRAVKDAGHDASLLARQAGTVQSMSGDVDKSGTFSAENWQLVTSRSPDDLEAFDGKITEVLAVL